MRLPKKFYFRSGRIPRLSGGHHIILGHNHYHVCPNVQVPARCQDKMASGLVRGIAYRHFICDRQVSVGSLFWRGQSRLYLRRSWCNCIGSFMGFLLLHDSILWGSIYLHLRQKIQYSFCALQRIEQVDAMFFPIEFGTVFWIKKQYKNWKKNSFLYSYEKRK